MFFSNLKQTKVILSVFAVSVLTGSVLLLTLYARGSIKISQNTNSTDLAQATVGSKTELCHNSSGTTTNCTVDNSVLQGQVLGASLYGSLELVTINYIGNLQNPGLKVNSVTYCGEPMTNPVPALKNFQTGDGMRVEMWYKTLPKSGVCPVVVTFNGDPGQRVVSTTLLYNINSITPTGNSFAAMQNNPTDYLYPPNFNINAASYGPKDSLFVCGYSIFPEIINGQGNNVTVRTGWKSLWKFEDMKIGSNTAQVWAGLGTYTQRDVDDRFDSVIWKTTKGTKWSATCANFNVKPFGTLNPTAAPNPVTVDLKVSNSNGPVTIPYNSSITLSWTSTLATSCTASGAWTGTKGISGSQVIAGLIASGTYTLTCNGVSDSVSVVVIPPTVNLKIGTSDGPVTIPYNGSYTLSWTTQGATACTASGSWTGAQLVNGSLLVTAVTANKTYTLTCNGGTDSISVVVTQPTVDLKIGTSDGPVTVPYNGSLTLNWTTKLATSCVSSGAWTGARLLNGSLVVTAVTTNRTYTLTCNGVTDSVSVVVTPPTVDLKIGTSNGPVTIPYNGSLTLAWTTKLATSCVSSGAWTGVRPLNGSLTVTAVTTNRTYTLTCNGVTDSVSVVVTPPTVDLKIGTSDGPVNVPNKGSFTLSWTTKLATACTATGSWIGAQLLNGSLIVSNVTTNKTYTLTCNGVSDTISVVALPPVVTVDLQGNTSLLWGDSLRLNWYTSNATSCTASGGWTGTKAITGTEDFYSMSTSKTYTLTCNGVSDSVAVTVAPLPAPTETGNITYKLITPVTLPTTFTRGQVVALVYKITEPDGTPGTPEEGFNVQTYVDNATQSVVGVNGVYNATTGYWTSTLTMPALAGTYKYYSGAGCGRWKSGRYSCGYKYTTYQQQQSPNPSVSIVVK